MIVLGIKVEAEPVRCGKCRKAAPLYKFYTKKKARLLCRFCLESVAVDKMNKHGEK